MALRFRRSIKLAPGIRMNLSGSGAGLSLGPRGASVSIGRRGTYLNSSLPGTGLYSRQSLTSGGSSRSNREAEPPKTVNVSMTLTVEDDVLVVTKLDRLGHNAMDVRAPVEALAGMGVRVNCLALGNLDLTSLAGKMTMDVINAVAECERDRLIERTQAGLAPAQAEGKALGRRPSLDEEKTRKMLSQLEAAEATAAVAREFDTSRQTIRRVRDAAMAA